MAKGQKGDAGAVFVSLLKSAWCRTSPQWGCDRGATKSDGFLRESPSGGGSFARIPRWLGPHSPLRGCSVLTASAPAKIPRRRTPGSFQTDSLDAQSERSETEHRSRSNVDGGEDGVQFGRLTMDRTEPPQEVDVCI